MEESGEAGRFLVASRDIQKGEVLKILNFDDDDDDNGDDDDDDDDDDNDNDEAGRFLVAHTKGRSVLIITIVKMILISTLSSSSSWLSPESCDILMIN